MSRNRVALVFGAGDGLGGAIARRFAREGLHACVVRRKADALVPLCAQIEAAGGRATAFGVDARDEDQVGDLVERIESQIGPIEVAVHNIGANVSIPVVDFSSRKFYKIWQMACFSGFLLGREAARRMLPRGRGTILFTGATASLRGRAGMAGFAGAKHALRALAQSMARELGPQGIHVAHVVIDGGIDGDRLRRRLPDIATQRGADGLLGIDAIAETYWHLHRQHRSAWAQEIDLRPYKEPF